MEWQQVEMRTSYFPLVAKSIVFLFHDRRPHRRLFDIAKPSWSKASFIERMRCRGRRLRTKGPARRMTSLFFDKKFFAAARSSRMILQDCGQPKSKLAAQDAFLGDDRGLSIEKGDGFRRATPDALIATPAIVLFAC
jgi:hypothetical protein